VQTGSYIVSGREKKITQATKNHNDHLVGGFNQYEKYARQIGSFPQGSGMKIPKIFHLVILMDPHPHHHG